MQASKGGSRRSGLALVVRPCALAAAGSLVGFSLSLAVTAHANGRMAAGHQLVVSPTDPTLFVMETTFGLLISHDSGNTFGWVCESAVGYGDGGVQDPSIGLTPTFVLAAMRQGLSLSSDLGCSWKLALADPVIDLVVRADDPHTVLALTSKSAGVDDAGENLSVTRILVTHDDGASWSQQGAFIDPAVQVETIDVAPSDSNRIYIGGARRRATTDGGTERVAVVLASTDGGVSYSESDIALMAPYETNQGAAFVSAVDPSNPDRVYVRIADIAVDRLIVSDDRGATFRTAYQGSGNLLGFALSSDGSKVFVGGPVDGVVLAATTIADSGDALQFVHQSSARVSCLSWIGGSLYACMGEPEHPFVPQLGVSTDDGVTFATKFPFACTAGALACPGGELSMRCNPGLPQLRASIGSCDAGTAQSDAGGAAQDAGSDGGGGVWSSPEPQRGCRCGAGGAPATGGLSALVLLATLLLRKRRPLNRTDRSRVGGRLG
ncbi:MAG TPA: hypothetical protein VGY54_22725 [Polyangiaceae bacterium]|jgi:hypothetical protein|nr:hypothetical protein [Polyangiaceae bacterium]